MTEDQNNTPPSATDIEALLREQTVQLDAVFQKFVTSAMNSHLWHSSMKTALRAQSQCQITARTLQLWQRLNTKSDKDA